MTETSDGWPRADVLISVMSDNIWSRKDLKCIAKEKKDVRSRVDDEERLLRTRLISGNEEIGRKIYNH